MRCVNRTHKTLDMVDCNSHLRLCSNCVDAGVILSSLITRPAHVAGFLMVQHQMWCALP